MANETTPIEEFDPLAKKDWIRSFLDFDICSFERLLRTKGEDYWQKKGEEKALHLFHLAAQHVPAYKDFLKKHDLDPDSIKTIHDFQKVPLTDKKNYIQRYKIADRCWNGVLAQSSLAAVSSGTTGEPSFWPRSEYQEYESGIIHELIYRSLFEMDKCKTLVVIGFPMGVYVSGIATTLPSWMISAKGYDVTFLTVGINKPEVLRAIESLRDEYDQVVLIGHPFFIKDVIETGKTNGLDWGLKRLRLLFCSEGFDESWRQYVMDQAGIREDSYASVINTYGSSEMLLMAHETPLTIFLRGTLERNKQLNNELMSSSVTPNIFQYNPCIRYIESVDSNLVFTAASGIPLIRFNMKDRGQVLPLFQVKGIIDAKQPDWIRDFEASGKHSAYWQLPFVTLDGRTDHTITFYGANIYPENIKIALNREELFSKVTGKFAMRRGYTEDKEQFLEINVELRPGIDAVKELSDYIQDITMEILKEVNREYLVLYNSLHKDLAPRIKLWAYQHEKYFKPGLKPKYIV